MTCVFQHLDQSEFLTSCDSVCIARWAVQHCPNVPTSVNLPVVELFCFCCR